MRAASPTLKRAATHQTGRAWIELDRRALRQNVTAVSSLLPDSCRIMPAVKAEAYGHGGVLVSKELNRLGIDAFCVASVSEGVALRKGGVSGEILILGYTPAEELELLEHYRLTQAVVDHAYAQILNAYARPLRVHLGIDTGMHRLGERYENFERLAEICEMENLHIRGIFTHLCAADSDRELTLSQAESFYSTAERLKPLCTPDVKLHIQASTGTINYPQFAGDYARIGIALYGMLSTAEASAVSPIPLRPVLSLKARVASVRPLYRGESLGYGADFRAERDMRIATIGIGYADGLPRSLSNGVGHVLINGQKARILGRICMDQTMVDVSEISGVSAGDIAVIIGDSGRYSITACDIAENCGTISNEILSRLGARLERFWI